ncbi:cation:proton antiporter [Nocardioides sp. GCM10027113]|uniref:cation:proton antiporter n=1 Tax=unclassified Nocardioides TaxID=2615069 RepID=UPI0036065683
MEHGLDVTLVAVLAACIVAWSLLSARLERANVTAPMVFVALGLLLATEPVNLVEVPVRSEGLRTLAEVTLALLLFHGAAYVDLRMLLHDAGVPLRLLVVGLPLTVAAGTGLAVLLLTDIDPWAAAAIAAAVAPTDAALGEAVTEDEEVPQRIRRTLSVESGLNDGIATPFVLFFVATAVGDEEARAMTGPGDALAQMALGVLVGLAVGYVGGRLLAASLRRSWVVEDYQAIMSIALALACYSASVAVGGNGFIAAFVGGLAFGTVVDAPVRDVTLRFDIRTGELLSLLVWFFFGAVMLPSVADATWQVVLFAVLALTVMRMVPVAVSLLGSGNGLATVAFIGWFGPRGMASVVFGLIAFDELQGGDADVVLTAVSLTIALSVVAHGLSAQPWARRYAMRSMQAEEQQRS